MQKFWIAKTYVPENQRTKDVNSCMQISIPDKCQHCNREIVIHLGYGDKTRPNAFDYACDHFNNYNLVWENRIIDKVFSSVNVDPINDGMKCSGACGLWAHMAEPNQPDNTFKCYSCRNRGW